MGAVGDGLALTAGDAHAAGRPGTVSFKNDPEQKREEVWLSDAVGRLRPFARAETRGNKCDIEHRSIEAASLRNPVFPDLESSWQDELLGTAELFGMMDHALFAAAQRMFAGMRVIPADRTIPATGAPARQSNGFPPDGRNLPGTLNDLRRTEQAEFDRHMASVTHGDPTGVKPRIAGSDLVLEAQEEGLSRNTSRADLGTVQIQTLILGLQAFGGSGAVFVVTEPELHLHAERQKRMLRLIRDKSARDGTQSVIETHSPVFLETGPGESTVLATKDSGRSRATEIAPDNVGLIRREMGITHADASSPTNILLAEGPSDLVTFGPFLKAVAPEHVFLTMVYNLDGAYNTMNIGMLIRCLKTEGCRTFVILDENGRAKRQVEELEGDGLLDGNYHFLEYDLEDEFDSYLDAEAACEMAAEAGRSHALTAGELDASRKQGNDAAPVLRNVWSGGKRGPFSKSISPSTWFGSRAAGCRPALRRRCGPPWPTLRAAARGAAPCGGAGRSCIRSPPRRRGGAWRPLEFVALASFCRSRGMRRKGTSYDRPAPDGGRRRDARPLGACPPGVARHASRPSPCVPGGDPP